MRNRVEAMLEEALQMFASRETQPQMAADINRREEIIDDATQELKDLHIERLNQGKCSVPIRVPHLPQNSLVVSR